MRWFFLLQLVLISNAFDKQPGCCSYGDPCWPKTADVEELITKLGGNSINRTLYHTGGAYPAPMPAGSDQPLGGAGIHLNAVYVQPESDRHTPCTEWNEYCKISMRNQPRDDTTPAFVVWPTTAEHVQEAVKFRVKHNLCISVAGTGHDFMNRHSNHESLLIRTTLLKSIDVDLSADNALQHPNVKVGAGSTHSEIQHAISKHGKMIVSPWSGTIGILGWSTGGGLGPNTPMNGLGADNILEAQIVTADGNLITTNANENENLYRAIRGGGAAPWGVFTSITVRLHDFPSSGVTRIEYKWEGAQCRDPNYFDTIVNNYLGLILTMGPKWGGQLNLSFHSRQRCNEWYAQLKYYYYGETADTDFQQINQKLKTLAPNPSVTEMALFDNDFDRIAGHEYTYPERLGIHPQHKSSSMNTLPSVLVSRETVEDGTMAQVFKSISRKFPLASWNFQHYLTGNIGSPQELNTSLSDGFRSALFNLVHWGAGDFSYELEQLGKNSYYAESPYNMQNWKEQYWGAENYERLLSVKHQYDPNNIFWCWHCIGSENGRFS